MLMYRLLAVLILLVAAAVPAAAATQPFLEQPFDVLGLPNGHLVVTDLSQGHVLDIDPAHRSGRIVGSIRNARELDRLPDGRYLVSSANRVFALDPRTKKAASYATFKSYLLGIALAPDGWLYGSENVPGQESTTIARVRGGVREMLVPALRGVHELLVEADGTLILCEAYGGRLLRLDPATKAVTVLGTGMKNPSSAVDAPGGGWFVTEFFGDRVSRVRPDGHVTKVADVYKPGPLAYDSKRRLVGAGMSGEVWRISHGTAQTIYP